MDTNKFTIIFAHLFFLSTAVFFGLGFVQMAHMAFPFLVFKTKAAFIAYNAWGVLMSGLCSYALFKEEWKLFWISVLILLLLTFFPWIAMGWNA